jgi:NADPH-dependent glutamate synthase beta subunit-like oxidoreductase
MGDMETSLTINGKHISIPEGSSVLDAAEKAGAAVPTLCYLKGQPPFTSCMICLVEDVSRGILIPACSTRAEEGMAIITDNERVLNARRETLGLLLAEHVGDCRAPCTRACPSGLPIPVVIRKVQRGDISGALALMRHFIPFPAIIGRVCPAPCEKVCRRKQMDESIAIRLLERYCGDFGSEKKAKGMLPSPIGPVDVRRKRIAIVGSGPAGLSAAYHLACRGYRCSIFEKEAEPGGGLREVILSGSFSTEIINEEINYVLGDSVDFHYNFTIGKDIALSDLKRDYDAVLCATGNASETPGESPVLNLHTTRTTDGQVNFTTGGKGVFACGAAIRPMRIAVRALSHGKAAAELIHSFLTGHTPAGMKKQYDSIVKHIVPEECEALAKVASHTHRVKTKEGMTSGFSEDEAILEAHRCLHCDCYAPLSCLLRKYATEYGVILPENPSLHRNIWKRDASHPEVVHEPAKCIKCGRCVRITENMGGAKGMSFMARGAETGVYPPFHIPIAEALGELAAACVQACPTGALAFKEREEITDETV